MLECTIPRARRSATSAILRHYAERFLSNALLLPSARFGLYAAAKELLSPGDRVIISPVTCRTVLGALKAAGLIPLFTDIEADTGNIDISKVTEPMLRSAKAIITTNLYGSPDHSLELRQIARRHGLAIIEDCAHVIDSSVDGQATGSIGDVSVFSFKKYFDLPGGVITVRDQALSAKIANRISAEATLPIDAEESARFVQYCLDKAVPNAVMRAVSHAFHAPRPQGSQIVKDFLPRPVAHEMYSPQHRRDLPTTAALCRVVEVLRKWDALVNARRTDTEYLIAHCALPVRKSCHASRVCYLAVPFSTNRRDAMVEALKQHGIPIYFLYTPPDQNCLRESLAFRLDVEMLRDWCATNLPVNPAFARESVQVLNSLA